MYIHTCTHIHTHINTCNSTAPCVTSELKDQHVQEGEDVVIQVIATGSPEIIWYTNGQIIADDKHFELDEDNGSTLIIHDVKMTHAGVYEFTATNSLGSVKGQMRVFVKQKKGPPVDEVVPSKESLNSESVLQLVYLSQLAGYVSDLINNCNGGFKRQFQVSTIFSCIHVYMYICTCMHICIYVYVFSYIHVYMYICTCMHVYMYMYICICILIYTCVYVYTYMYACTMYMYACTMYIHTCT